MARTARAAPLAAPVASETSTDLWSDLTGLIDAVCLVLNCPSGATGSAAPPSGDPVRDAVIAHIVDQMAVYKGSGIRRGLSAPERAKGIASVIDLQTFLEANLDLLPQDLTLSYYATLEDIRHDLSN